MFDYEGLITDLLDESDVCRNEGAEDIADLLEKAATAIKTLMMPSPSPAK